jgi:hypothetical protein
MYPAEGSCLHAMLLDTEVPSAGPIPAWIDSFMLISLKSAAVQAMGRHFWRQETCACLAEHLTLPHVWILSARWFPGKRGQFSNKVFLLTQKTSEKE